jgi:hypothetical protein
LLKTNLQLNLKPFGDANETGNPKGADMKPPGGLYSLGGFYTLAINETNQWTYKINFDE